ncbi:MAG: thioredoxin [Akkermansia sp.]
MAIQISGSNFETEVLQSSVPVLVDFWATWCGPCKMISPIVDQIAVELAGTAKVCKANVDDAANGELCNHFNIRSIPTLLFFKDGELKDTIVGATSKENIVGRLRRLAL